MSRASGVKKLTIGIDDLNIDLFNRYYRRIIYLEMMEPRFSSMRDSVIHFYVLLDGKMQEFEILYADSAEFYHGFIGFIDRYICADMFRNYKFQSNEYSYRVLIHKGVSLDANNDLGGFVFQNDKTSHLISPRRHEIFDRLSKDLLNYSDGVAQLVKIGLLLENKQFCDIHKEYFGSMGLAGLKDGSIIKLRYADSVANNNVITDQNLFAEYLQRVNAIPMEVFTSESIVSQLAKDYRDTKKILMENYSNFLFADDDEIDFASMLLGLFTHRAGMILSTQEWVTGISYIKYLNDDTFIRSTESEQDFKRNLNIYRANYIIKNTSLPKLIHFIYDFFDYKNLSRNVGAFYPRLNALLGEDIRKKYQQLETKNVSLKSYQESKNPVDFFAEPQLVNFSTAADKEICKQIISGNYDHNFVCFYLCNYMQVADYKKYSDILPAVVSIIKDLSVKNEDDFNLFWMASDLLNQFWKLIPADNQKLQDEIEKMVFDIFWPRVGDIWPIKNRKNMVFNDENRTKEFNESLGWILCIDDKNIIDKKLKKYINTHIVRKDVDINDPVDCERYKRSFSKSKVCKLADFIGEYSDDPEWCYAAVCFDKIRNTEILARVFDFQYPLSHNRAVEKYTFEQLLLRPRDQKDAQEIYTYLLDNYESLNGFWEKIKNENEAVEQLKYDTLMALSESAIDNCELDLVKKLAKKMSVDASEVFLEKVKHVFAVMEARIHHVKFQTRGIDKDFICKLH